MNFQITPVVRNLLIINVFFFIVDHYLFNLTEIFALRYIFSAKFYPFQFVTYMFLHSEGFSHIFFNMFALFMFGPMLERQWGAKRFLIFYLITGIGAGLIHAGFTFYEMYNLQRAIEAYTANPTPVGFNSLIRDFGKGIMSVNFEFIQSFKDNPESQEFIRETIRATSKIFQTKADIPMIGASGAVFAILMAFGLTFPQLELFIFPLPVPIKAWLYVTVYGIIELYSGVHSAPGDNVAHFAHIGGMIFAFILIRLWRHKGTDEFY